MKRPLSSHDSEPAFFAAVPLAKRCRSHSESKPVSKPLLLTREAPSPHREPTFSDAVSIEHWIDSCAHGEMMNPDQPHPRLVAQTLRRAKARARTPSPVKKPPQCATAEYRNGTMKLAQVFVERDPELPGHVAAHVARIFGTDTARDVDRQESDEDRAWQALEATLAESYRKKSRLLARACAGEGEWRGAIYSALMDPLITHWSPALVLSASDEPWNKYLKPNVLQWSSLTIPRLPTFPTPSYTLSQNEPSSSSAASVAVSDSSSGDKLQLSTPKPDVTVGLASDTIMDALKLPQDVLLLLQTDPGNPQPFISDPHQVQLGLRFPFLIVEAKGLNTGVNLMHAQNQAAVAAASALNILNDLIVRTPLTPESHLQDNVDPNISTPTIVFSIATEGPTHELWVHYQVNHEYHMFCLQSWRTTLPGHAEMLVSSLGQIMRWATGSFKEDVVERVRVLWASMCPAEEEWVAG